MKAHELPTDPQALRLSKADATLHFRSKRLYISILSPNDVYRNAVPRDLHNVVIVIAEIQPCKAPSKNHPASMTCLLTPMDESKAAAIAFLTSLLSKTLRITTSDTRLFVGEFKCTDADRNIILARTYEYRLPTRPSAANSTTISTNASAVPLSSLPPLSNSLPSTTQNPEAGIELPNPGGTNKVVMDMTSRYLGLVVVPGEFITKVEVEEFTSQVKAAGGSRYTDLGMLSTGEEKEEVVV